MPAMTYQIDSGDGSGPKQASEQDIMNGFQQKGYPVTGVTADGLYMTGQQPAENGKAGQSFKVPISGALQSIGHTVVSASPSQPDTQHVEPLISGMVSAMPSDNNMRKSYIEHTLKSRGIQNPTVIGSGNNWHAFNPGTQQWAQIAKDPGWDMSGLASAAINAPHYLGAMAGGLGGAALGGGLGSIPAAAAGGAAGSLAGTAVTDAGMMALDPDYAAAVNDSKNGMSELGTDALKTAGWDALGEGVGIPAGKVIGKATEPLARGAAALIGGAGDALGDLAGWGAKKVGSSDLAGDLAAQAVGGVVGGADQVGQGLRIPAEAIKAPANVAESVSGWQWPHTALKKIADFLTGNKVVSPMLSEESQAAVQQGAQGLSDSLSGLQDKLGNFAQNQFAKGETAQGVLQGVGAQRTQKATAQYMGDEGWQAAEEQAGSAAREMAPQYGIDPDVLEANVRQDFRQKQINRIIANTQEDPNALGNLGRGADQLAAAGKVISGTARGAISGGLRVVQGAAKTAGAAGNALPYAEWIARNGLLPLGIDKGSQALYDYENRKGP